MLNKFKKKVITGILLAVLSLVSAADATEFFAVGTAANNVDLRQAAGAVPLQDGWAIPLRGARPDWYTPALQRTVLLAADEPVAAPLDSPLLSEIGIRPRAWMQESPGCMMNFVFTSGTRRGIGGTAGHCVDSLGQHVVLLTLALDSGNLVLKDIGTIIVRRNAGIGNDSALVEIRPQLHSRVSPTTAIIAGACGAYSGFGQETVMHYSHCLAIGTSGTPRAGLALTWKASSYCLEPPRHLRRFRQSRAHHRSQGRWQSHPSGGGFSLFAELCDWNADQQNAQYRKRIEAGCQPLCP
jgi:hypothetical protein